MADDDDSADKPFEATPRKLQEARKRGEVPVSQDLVTFGVYLGILAAALLLGAWTVDQAGTALLPFLASPETMTAAVFGHGGRLGLAPFLGPVAAACLVWLVFPYVFALLSAFAQGALIFAPTKLQPRLSRVSPVKNAKQKFGPEGLFNFVKSMAKLAIYSIVLGMVFQSHLDEILGIAGQPVPAIIGLVAELCFRFLASAAVVIFAISIVDFLWQRAQFMRRQRMSLQELKEETKETEGDPYTKQARRQRGYDIATNRMIADVPGADVVVVNPEHYAVALRWDRTRGSAPVCVAKGIDAVADRIREAAIEHAVPIYRDPPTARALFAVVDLGDEIPTEHYRAIAAAIRFADAMREKARNRRG